MIADQRRTAKFRACSLLSTERPVLNEITVVDL